MALSWSAGLLCLLVGQVLALSHTEPGELVSLVVFFRHGARSPLEPIPALDRKMHWPMGYGQLTPMGERQLYLLGRALRRIYGEQEKFLSPIHNESQVYLRTTDYARTIASAQCLANGLYGQGLTSLSPEQLKDESIWKPPFRLSLPEDIVKELLNSSLPYDVPAIPISSVDRAYDRFLSFASCPRYYSFWDPYFKSARYQALLDSYNTSLVQLCGLYQLNCTGLNSDYAFSLVDYVLAAEFDGRLKLLSDQPSLQAEIDAFYTQLLVGVLTSDSWMQKLVMHSFSSVILTQFDAAIATPGNAIKAALLATHDTVLLAYLLGLEVPPDSEILKSVPFASHIILELRKNQTASTSNDDQHYVNITYNGRPLFVLSYTNFKIQVKKAGQLDKSWEEDCALKLSPPQDSVQWSTTIGLIVGGMALFGLVFAAIKGSLTTAAHKDN